MLYLSLGHLALLNFDDSTNALPIYSQYFISAYSSARELGRDPNFYEIFRKMHVKKAYDQFVDNKSQMIADLVEERVTTASQPVEGSMDLQPIDYDPIYLETIRGQKKQRVYGLGSKGVAFCSSSRASSSSVTAAVDEAIEQRVMETNERIAVMET